MFRWNAANSGYEVHLCFCCSSSKKIIFFFLDTSKWNAAVIDTIYCFDKVCVATSFYVTILVFVGRLLYVSGA